MAISLQNLLSEISPDDLIFQKLDESVTGASRKKNGDSELKFVTSENWGMGPGFSLETQKLGLVLWLDRAEVKNILASGGPSPKDVDSNHESHLRLLRTALQYLTEKGVEAGTLTNSSMLDMLDSVDALFDS